MQPYKTAKGAQTTMQTQDATEQYTATNAFGECDHVTFGGTHEIRRAMAAARTIMGKPDGADRWSPSCRLVGLPERHEVEVLATDGNRTMRMRVAAERSRDDEVFDEPLHGDAVRALSRTTTPVLTITATGDALVITDRVGAQRRFPKGVALQRTAFARILDTPPNAAIAPDVMRTAALRALHAMPPQREGEKVCRMSVSRHGLKAWANASTLVGPEYRADVELAVPVASCPEEIVFGIEHRLLIDALRTMTAGSVSLRVEAPDKPIRISSNDGLETMVIAAQRLG